VGGKIFKCCQIQYQQKNHNFVLFLVGRRSSDICMKLNGMVKKRLNKLHLAQLQLFVFQLCRWFFLYRRQMALQPSLSSRQHCCSMLMSNTCCSLASVWIPCVLLQFSTSNNFHLFPVFLTDSGSTWRSKRRQRRRHRRRRQRERRQERERRRRRQERQSPWRSQGAAG
jgi:hypothetical protein